jgi:hypothetical protein
MRRPTADQMAARSRAMVAAANQDTVARRLARAVQTCRRTMTAALAELQARPRARRRLREGSRAWIAQELLHAYADIETALSHLQGEARVHAEQAVLRALDLGDLAADAEHRLVRRRQTVRTKRRARAAILDQYEALLAAGRTARDAKRQIVEQENTRPADADAIQALEQRLYRARRARRTTRAHT